MPSQRKLRAWQANGDIVDLPASDNLLREHAGPTGEKPKRYSRTTLATRNSPVVEEKARQVFLSAVRGPNKDSRVQQNSAKVNSHVVYSRRGLVVVLFLLFVACRYSHAVYSRRGLVLFLSSPFFVCRGKGLPTQKTASKEKSAIISGFGSALRLTSFGWAKSKRFVANPKTKRNPNARICEQCEPIGSGANRESVFNCYNPT